MYFMQFVRGLFVVVAVLIVGGQAHAGATAKWLVPVPVTQTPNGEQLWADSAFEACAISKQYLNPGAKGMNISYADWKFAYCHWCASQFCPGYGDTVLPGGTGLWCIGDPGDNRRYELIEPGLCVLSAAADTSICGSYGGARPIGSGEAPNSCSAPIHPFCEPTEGNPVVLSNGAKVETAIDFQTADGLLMVERSYRSAVYGGRGFGGRGLQYQDLGTGWATNFSWSLAISENFGSLKFVDVFKPDGTVWRFDINGSGVGSVASFYRNDNIGFNFTSPTSFSYAGVVNNGGEVKITDQDGTVRIIELYKIGDEYPRGRLKSVSTPEGYTQTITYLKDAQIDRVTDSFGRVLKFTWNEQLVENLDGAEIPTFRVVRDAIDEIRLSNGQRLRFNYGDALSSQVSDHVMLQSVERLQGNGNLIDRVRYHYEDERFPFLLTGITDQKNVRYATFAYDDQARTIVSEHTGTNDRHTFEYNEPDNPFFGTLSTTVTNPLGKRSTYSFDIRSGKHLYRGVQGEATSNCPASVREVTWSFNQNLQREVLDTVVDAEGRQTRFTNYDSRLRPRRVTRGTGPDAQLTDYGWSNVNNRPTFIQTQRLRTNFTYNANGRLTRVDQIDRTTHTTPYSTNGERRIWRFGYGVGGRVTWVDGPLVGNGDTIRYAYHSNGNLRTVTNELGQVTTVNASNSRGQPTKYTDPNGLVTTLKYDALGRLTQIIEGSSNWSVVTSIAYDKIGQVTRITRPGGRYLQFSYNGARRLTRVRNAKGDRIDYSYNRMGNVTRSLVRNGSNQIRYDLRQTFDELGRVLKSIGVSNREWAYGYTKENEVASVTDPRGKSWSYAYDGLGRLMTSTSPLNEAVVQRYEKDDTPKSYTDPRNIVTEFVHNGFGELILETSPDTGAMVYRRDSRGLVTRKTDGRGVAADYTYDVAGRLKTIKFPGAAGENVTFTHDETSGGNKGIGRLTSVNDQGGVTRYVYDILGRVKRETRVIANRTLHVNYTYDRDNQITSITYPSGRRINYARDAEGLVSGVTMQVGDTSTTLASNILYEPFGPVRAIDYGNGVKLRRTFNRNYEMTAMTVTRGAQTRLDLAFTYGDRLNITQVADALDGTFNATYAYDASNRLVDYNGSQSLRLRFGYDPSGNRTSRREANRTAVQSTFVNGTNRISQLKQGTTVLRSFDYDGAGNMVSDRHAPSGVTTAYVYNRANRLRQLKQGNAVQGTYIYNAFGQMVRRVAGGETTLYLHDLDGNVISEVDGSGTVRRDYVWVEHRGTSSATQAPGTALPLVQVTGLDTPGQEIAWIHTDHQNRQVILTNATGGLVRTVVTTPFGMLAKDSGQTVHQTSAGFAGQWKLPEAGTNGLQYNWHRHYDPTLGRYTQPDPLGLIDGPSRYGYALQNPVRFEDPRGEASRWQKLLGGLGALYAGETIPEIPNMSPREPAAIVYCISPPDPLLSFDNIWKPTSVSCQCRF